MGGCIALSFAALYPERVDGLGLIDTTAWYGEGAPERWAERGRKGREEGMLSLADFQRARWFTEDFLADNPETVKDLLEVFAANDTRAYEATCNMLGAADERAALSGFDFPCRIVVGENDGATPVAMAEALKDGISGASLTVLPRLRHFTPVEAPGEISEILGALSERAYG